MLRMPLSQSQKSVVAAAQNPLGTASDFYGSFSTLFYATAARAAIPKFHGYDFAVRFLNLKPRRCGTPLLAQPAAGAFVALHFLAFPNRRVSRCAHASRILLPAEARLASCGARAAR